MNPNHPPNSSQPNIVKAPEVSSIPTGPASSPQTTSSLPLTLAIIALCVFWLPVVGIILAIASLILKNKKKVPSNTVTIYALVAIFANIGMTTTYMVIGSNTSNATGKKDFPCYSVVLPSGFIVYSSDAVPTELSSMVEDKKNCSGIYEKTIENNRVMITSFTIYTALTDPSFMSDLYKTKVETVQINGRDTKRHLVDRRQYAASNKNNAEDIISYSVLYDAVDLNIGSSVGNKALFMSFDLTLGDNKTQPSDQEVTDFIKKVNEIVLTLKVK